MNDIGFMHRNLDEVLLTGKSGRSKNVDCTELDSLFNDGFVGGLVYGNFAGESVQASRSL